MEEYHIERLERTGRMRRKDCEENPMSIALVDKLSREMRSLAIRDEQSPSRCFVQRLNTCLSQASPKLLFDQPVRDEEINTSCSPALISSTQLDRMAL
jgi:hypothetical protein